jgi:hypothetical protein
MNTIALSIPATRHSRVVSAGLALAFCGLLGLAPSHGEEAKKLDLKLVGDQVPGEWVELFNGKDLTGWTPKFKGHPSGTNHKNTFRVENGVLRVVYDDYEKWDGAFGHLFHEGEYSHYILRVVYRFTGKQAAGGPGWAIRNNGIMFHGQKPADMQLDQDFPNSLEFQFLGGLGSGERATGSLCTPGTDVKIDGKLTGRHVIESNGPTFHGDDWVTLELEVRGDRHVRHWADGKVILEYHEPQLDGGKALGSGTVSIQAESSPAEFKSIQIKVLSPDAPMIPDAK